ncbi:hypothetical protein GCM10023185_29950 [Hymenobacter saemangeumensis]|uniref:Helix-turn-helix domain-containing protein n=2 Tax=Hymenobacter saemangeumensis TaxID=1084522 RepID=A0ABP8ILT5_9BACT
MSVTSHDLFIPEWILNLSVGWDARLVLAEVLNLYKCKGQVWAEDDYFVDRLRLSKRSVGRAMKELEVAQVLYRDTKQNRKHKRLLTPSFDGKPVAHLAADLLPDWQEPIANLARGYSQDGKSLLPNGQEPIANLASINKNLIDKGNTNQTNSRAGENFSSLSQSSVTAPNPVAAPPSPAAPAAVALCLEPGTPESRALAAEMAEYWHIREGKDARRWAQFATFTRTLAAQGRLDEVREQFAAYKAFREIRGFQRHGIDKILGSEGLGYTNSALLHEGSWVAQLEEAQTAAKTKPSFGPAPSAEKSSAAPSNRKQTWK